MRYGYDSHFDSVRNHSSRIILNMICNSEVPTNAWRPEPKKPQFSFSDFDYRDMMNARYNTNHESRPVIPDHPASASPSTTKRRRSAMDPEVMKNYRVDLIDRFSSHELMALNILYRENGGKLPSRRGLKEYSDKIGISQAKIKRWFERTKEEHDHQSSSPKARLLSIDASDDSDTEAYKGLMNEMEDHLAQVQDINCQITNIISGLLRDKPSL